MQILQIAKGVRTQKPAGVLQNSICPAFLKVTLKPQGKLIPSETLMQVFFVQGSQSKLIMSYLLGTCSYADSSI